jgi:cathepsin L
MAINSGPVIVNLCISDPAIKFYSRGIFDIHSRCKTDKKHAVTVIGYGEESEKEYLLIKNSWGTFWGEKGFMKLLLSEE